MEQGQWVLAATDGPSFPSRAAQAGDEVDDKPSAQSRDCIGNERKPQRLSLGEITFG